MAVWKVDLSVGVLAGMTAASRAEMLVFLWVTQMAGPWAESWAFEKHTQQWSDFE
jgi:hypothetical protein